MLMMVIYLECNSLMILCGFCFVEYQHQYTPLVPVDKAPRAVLYHQNILSVPVGKSPRAVLYCHLALLVAFILLS